VAEQIRVLVHLHAELARHAPAAERGTLPLELPVGATIQDLLQRLDLPRERRIIVGLNGQSAAAETVLRDGDRLDLVTPMSGG